MKPLIETLRELADKLKKQSNIPEDKIEAMKKTFEAAKKVSEEVKSKKV